MSKWIGVITNDGNDLLSEWANEKTLNFDKVIFGTGTVAAEAMIAQSNLVSQKQVASIVGSERVESGIRLKIQITAADVSYVLNQIGVWASVEDAEPVMLALYQYTTGVSVPSKVESPEFVYTFYALISTSNQGQWIVNVDTSALVTREQLDSHTEDKNNPHGMTREQIGAASAELVDEISALVSANAAAIMEHTEDKNNPHGMTRGQIGAAPDGYGLGQAKLIEGNIDTITAPGWYCLNKTTTLGGITADYWYMHVSAYGTGGSYCMQKAYPCKGNSTVELVRFRTSDAWSSFVRSDDANHITSGTLDSARLPIVPIAKGGTGAATATAARTALGITPSNIGAAPAGYGLGAASVDVNDLNTCIKNGWYWIGEDTLNVPTGLEFCAVYVSTRLNNQIVQTLTGINRNKGSQMIRISTDTGVTWYEEWVNPPLIVGVEYRTTERFEGKPVYAKQLNFGSGTTGQKAVDITTGHIKRLVRVEGGWSDGTNEIPFDDSYCVAGITVDNYYDNARIIVEMTTNAANYTGYPVVYYTKS